MTTLSKDTTRTESITISRTEADQLLHCFAELSQPETMDAFEHTHDLIASHLDKATDMSKDKATDMSKDIVAFEEPYASFIFYLNTLGGIAKKIQQKQAEEAGSPDQIIHLKADDAALTLQLSESELFILGIDPKEAIRNVLTATQQQPDPAITASVISHLVGAKSAAEMALNDSDILDHYSALQIEKKQSEEQMEFEHAAVARDRQIQLVGDEPVHLEALTREPEFFAEIMKKNGDEQMISDYRFSDVADAVLALTNHQHYAELYTAHYQKTAPVIGG